MTDSPVGSMPFSLDSIWAMEPLAFERLRSLVQGSSHERLAAAATQTAASRSADTPYENSGGVAVIPFSGVVTKRSTIWSRVFGGRAVTSELISALAQAKADPDVKSVLLIVDSPGGTVEGTSDAADAVATLEKPVTAYIQDTGASAAYWIASQAGRLVGNPTANVGSIGVFATIPDISRLVKNMGVEVNIVKSVNGKAGGMPGTPVTDSQLSEVQRLVDATHSLFVAAVNRGRGRDMSAVADGRVHLGMDAVNLGLLDAIEPLSTTLNSMIEAAKPKEKTMTESFHVTTTEALPTTVTVAAAPAPAPVDHTDEIASMRTRLEAVEKVNTEKEAESLIEQARAERKLTPGLVETARMVAKHGGTGALKEFLAGLPVSAIPGGSVAEQPAPAALVARNQKDYVGGSMIAYDRQNASAHQAAIDYIERSGGKISYRDAIVAVTRKTA